MKVTAVTPSDAAASPTHPDHARWVKEQTLKREILHAQSVGLSARDAETTNMRALERLANRKQRPAKPKKQRAKAIKPETFAEAGVSVREAPKQKAPVSVCNFCGKCRTCRRDMRMVAIIQKGKQGDTAAEAMAWEIVGLLMASQQGSDYRDAAGRHYPFSIMNKRDRARAYIAGVEHVCDRSIALMGGWLL